MLARVQDFLDAEERERRAERADMKKLLAKLKKKEKDLKEEMATAEDEADRAALRVRLEVLHAQRRKGVSALKALKKKPAKSSG